MFLNISKHVKASMAIFPIEVLEFKPEGSEEKHTVGINDIQCAGHSTDDHTHDLEPKEEDWPEPAVV